MRSPCRKGLKFANSVLFPSPCLPTSYLTAAQQEGNPELHAQVTISATQKIIATFNQVRLGKNIKLLTRSKLLFWHMETLQLKVANCYSTTLSHMHMFPKNMSHWSWIWTIVNRSCMKHMYKYIRTYKWRHYSVGASPKGEEHDVHVWQQKTICGNPWPDSSCKKKKKSKSDLWSLSGQIDILIKKKVQSEVTRFHWLQKYSSSDGLILPWSKFKFIHFLQKLVDCSYNTETGDEENGGK